MLRVVMSKIVCSNSKPSPSVPGRCWRIENRPLHEPANGSTTPKAEPGGAVAATRATSSQMRLPSGSRTASSAVRAKIRTPRACHRGWRHAVKGNGIRVAKAVAPELLDLPQFDIVPLRDSAEGSRS